MLSRKKSPIEILLNKIIQEPDLSKEVFEYIAPHALKAYQILSIQKEEKVFRDNESLHQLEKMLNKSLPQIIDIYSKLPLEYRNQEKLKTGKTHRETLLDNIQILVNNMKAIEKNIYADLDNEAVVNSRIINEQFGSTEIALENDVEFKKEFDVANFKKSHPEFQEGKTNIDEDNRAIKVVEGKIEYKVRSKMKAFMNGVYHAYNGIKDYTSDKLELIEIKPQMIVMSMSSALIATFTIIMFMSALAPEKQEEMKMGELQKTSEETQEILGQGLAMSNENKAYLEQLTKIIKQSDERSDTYKKAMEFSEYTEASSNGLRDINMKVLEKLSQTNPNFKASLIDKGQTAKFEFTVNKNECLHFIKDMNKDEYGAYQINEARIEKEEKISASVADMACDIENKITLKYHAKKQ